MIIIRTCTPTDKTETLHHIEERIVHGSAPIRVEESPTAVPFKRSPVGHEQSITVDPGKLNGKCDTGGRSHFTAASPIPIKL